MGKRSRKLSNKHSSRPRRSKSSSRKTMKRTKRQPSKKRTLKKHSSKKRKSRTKSVRKRKKTKKVMKGGVKITDAPWYHGELTADEVKNLLATATKNNSFFVKTSSNPSSDHKYTIIVKNTTGIGLRKYRIMSGGGKYYINKVELEFPTHYDMFDTVVDLINAYKKKAFDQRSDVNQQLIDIKLEHPIQEPLIKYQWFVGKLGRTQAEKLFVVGKPDGTYLIRESERPPGGEYSLSVKYNNVIKHFKINKKGNMYDLAPGAEKFSSIPDLVEYYKTHSLNRHFPGMVTALKHPINKSISASHTRAHRQPVLIPGMPKVIVFDVDGTLSFPKEGCNSNNHGWNKGVDYDKNTLIDLLYELKTLHGVMLYIVTKCELTNNVLSQHNFEYYQKRREDGKSILNAMNGIFGATNDGGIIPVKSGLEWDVIKTQVLYEIMKTPGLQKNQIMLIDDDVKNVKMAIDNGFRGVTTPLTLKKDAGVNIMTIPALQIILSKGDIDFPTDFSGYSRSSSILEYEGKKEAVIENIKTQIEINQDKADSNYSLVTSSRVITHINSLLKKPLDVYIDSGFVNRETQYEKQLDKDNKYTNQFENKAVSGITDKQVEEMIKKDKQRFLIKYGYHQPAPKVYIPGFQIWFNKKGEGYEMVSKYPILFNDDNKLYVKMFETEDTETDMFFNNLDELITYYSNSANKGKEALNRLNLIGKTIITQTEVGAFLK